MNVAVVLTLKVIHFLVNHTKPTLSTYNKLEISIGRTLELSNNSTSNELMITQASWNYFHRRDVMWYVAANNIN